MIVSFQRDLNRTMLVFLQRDLHVVAHEFDDFDQFVILDLTGCRIDQCSQTGHLINHCIPIRVTEYNRHVLRNDRVFVSSHREWIKCGNHARSIRGIIECHGNRDFRRR